MCRSINTGLLILLMSFPHYLCAKNLGSYGKTYPIKEVHLFTWLQQKLKHLEATGELDALNQKMLDKARTYFTRPTPVAGVSTTQKAKSWLFDPSITLKKPIFNAQGILIAPAGKQINPLDTVSLSNALFFYNADDKKQVALAQTIKKEKKERVRLILVRGDIKTQSQLLQQSIYFDQKGSLTTHFKIQHVPALVEQVGRQLKISELLP